MSGTAVIRGRGFEGSRGAISLWDNVKRLQRFFTSPVFCQVGLPFCFLAESELARSSQPIPPSPNNSLNTLNMPMLGMIRLPCEDKKITRVSWCYSPYVFCLSCRSILFLCFFTLQMDCSEKRAKTRSPSPWYSSLVFLLTSLLSYLSPSRNTADP